MNCWVLKPYRLSASKRHHGGRWMRSLHTHCATQFITFQLLVCLKPEACKFYLIIWSLLVKYRVNDHPSSILSKLLITLLSASDLPVTFFSVQERYNLLCHFFYESHVVLQALPITLKSSASTLHFWKQPAVHTAFTNTRKSRADTVVQLCSKLCSPFLS